MAMEYPEDHTEFCPSDEARLIDGYLRPKIAGKATGTGYVHDADVCSDHPYDLVRGRAPAPGGTGDGRAWFFFSPERYVGGGARRGGRSSSRPGHRWRAVVGAGGEKKGDWHAEGRKEAVAGTAGGYCRSLTYHQATPSGSFVKPGWLMVEYGINDDEHGGGGMVLCKVYKSRRGPGSDVPPSRKRKVDVEAELVPPPRAAQPPPCVQMPQQDQPTEDDEMVGFTDALTAMRAFMETDEDEMGLQLPANFDPAEYLLGEHQHPGAAVPVPPPGAAQPEECVVQTSAGGGNVIEFSLEELMGSSSAHGQCSATPPSQPAWCFGPWMAPAVCAV